jgi:hypothetical protein
MRLLHLCDMANRSVLSVAVEALLEILSLNEEIDKQDM